MQQATTYECICGHGAVTSNGPGGLVMVDNPCTDCTSRRGFRGLREGGSKVAFGTGEVVGVINNPAWFKTRLGIGDQRWICLEYGEDGQAAFRGMVTSDDGLAFTTKRADGRLIGEVVGEFGDLAMAKEALANG